VKKRLNPKKSTSRPKKRGNEDSRERGPLMGRNDIRPGGDVNTQGSRSMSRTAFIKEGTGVTPTNGRCSDNDQDVKDATKGKEESQGVRTGETSIFRETNLRSIELRLFHNY